jgi:hypothetical protein
MGEADLFENESILSYGFIATNMLRTAYFLNHL